MSLVSSGISSSFKRELSSAHSHEAVLAVLKKNPENLLKFYLQSAADIKYYVQNKPLLDSVWIEVTHLTLTHVLSWSSVTKTYDLTQKYLGLEAGFPHDLTVKQDGSLLDYSRMVFMRDCPVLRKKWIDHPEERDFTLKDFAPKLRTLRELTFLYVVLCSHNYAQINDLKLEELLFLILQAKEWGSETAYVELQNHFSARLTGWMLPLNMYAASLSNNLDIIRKRVLELLDNARFYKDDALEIYYHFTFFLMDEIDLPEFNEEDRRRLAENFILNFSCFKQFFPAVRLEWVTIIMGDAGDALVCFKSTQDPYDIIKIANKLNHPTQLDKNRIKKLIFNRHYQLKDLSVIGMMRYFEEVEEAEFLEYDKINDDFIPLISQVRSNIKRLNFVRCALDELHYIELEYMTCLKSLKLFEQEITAISFTSLARMKHLENVMLLKCNISVPAECPVWEINSLNVNGSLFKKGEFMRMLSFCRHLKVLYCEDCADFSLDEYPNPETLEELYISSGHLKRAIKDGKIPAFDRYANLKKLSLDGEIDKDLKPVIVHYLHKFKITFRRKE